MRENDVDMTYILRPSIFQTILPGDTQVFSLNYVLTHESQMEKCKSHCGRAMSAEACRALFLMETASPPSELIISSRAAQLHLFR
jgi:hypothetical protein